MCVCVCVCVFEGGCKVRRGISVVTIREKEEEECTKRGGGGGGGIPSGLNSR